VGTLRVFLGGLVFLPVFIAHFQKVPQAKWKVLALSGLLGSFFPSLLFATAGAHMDSAVSGMLNGMTPLFTVVVSTIFFGYALNKNQLTGILIGFLGAMLLALANISAEGVSFDVWSLLVVLATLFYAFNVNILKNYLSDFSPIPLTGLTIFFAGLPASIILFSSTEFIHKMQAHTQAWQAFGYVCILGILGSAVAMVLFNKLIQISNAITASTVTYLMPVIAVLWGLADGEGITAWHFTGLTLILLGVYLVNMKKRI
jgi:drug/metabolite transporter (DMT)-like permease